MLAPKTLTASRIIARLPELSFNRIVEEGLEAQFHAVLREGAAYADAWLREHGLPLLQPITEPLVNTDSKLYIWRI